MKKLTAEEAKDLTIVVHGRTSQVAAHIANLQIGEALIITRAYWKGKRPPYGIVNRVSRKTSRKFIKGRLPDGTGWAVKRIA